MPRLTPEREKELRNFTRVSLGETVAAELFDEIDALRLALDNRNQTQVTGFCPLCVQAQSQIDELEEHRHVYNKNRKDLLEANAKLNKVVEAARAYNNVFEEDEPRRGALDLMDDLDKALKELDGEG